MVLLQVSWCWYLEHKYWLDIGLPRLPLLSRPTVQIDKTYQYQEPGLSISSHCAVNVLNARQEAKITLYIAQSLQNFRKERLCYISWRIENVMFQK